MAKSTARGRRKAASTRDRQKPVIPFRQKAYAFLKEVLITLAIVLVIQTFAFGSFHVPTPSMENNILVGDRLIASKVHYGGRTPQTIGIPFTNVFLPGLEFPWVRVPGFTSVKRDDIVVFNFPPEDKPVERKTHYVKRAVGLPGETIEVRDKQVYVDGTLLPPPDGSKEHYVATLTSAQVELPMSRLRALGVRSVQPLQDGLRFMVMEITREIADEIASWPYIASVEPFVIPASAQSGMEIFPEGSSFNPHQWGPVRIPARGDRVTLSDENWAIYRDVITRFEGHQAARLPDGTFEIDGQVTTTYQVEQDYYFMMGDNRDNSLDGRAWGFVPEDHVVAKVLFTYFSWNSERNLPRLGRIGSLVR